VDLRPQHLPAFLDRFPSDEFYVDGETAREAVEMGRQFNIIHPASGL